MKKKWRRPGPSHNHSYLNFLSMRSILFLLLLTVSLHASSEIALPSIIASNMVLQQRTDAPLWGKATARSRVTVTTSWDHMTYATMAAAVALPQSGASV